MFFIQTYRQNIDGTRGSKSIDAKNIEYRIQTVDVNIRSARWPMYCPFDSSCSSQLFVDFGYITFSAYNSVQLLSFLYGTLLLFDWMVCMKKMEKQIKVASLHIDLIIELIKQQGLPYGTIGYCLMTNKNFIAFKSIQAMDKVSPTINLNIT